MPRPIDGDALSKSLSDRHDRLGGTTNPVDHCIMDVLLSVIEDIEEAPTLDYAPVVHGEWIKDKDDLYWGNHFIHRRCSLCGGEAHINRFGTAYILSNFCPNCGANMDGGLKDANA